MYILGISGHKRNAAAALIKDGTPVSAFEEEKLVRNKSIGVAQCGGLPYESISYCLSQAGIGIEDVDYVACDFKPRRLLIRQKKFSRNFVEPFPGAEDYNAASLNEYHDRMNTLQLIKRLISGHSKKVTVDHQLAHAAGTFYHSGFDRAAILILSGKGDYISLSVGVGEGNKVNLHTRIEFPQSLGWIYSQMTEYLGYQPECDEHKTQWLSTTGEPEFLGAFEDLIQIDKKGMPRIDLSYFDLSFQRTDVFSEKFYQIFGDRLRRKNQRFVNGMMKFQRNGESAAFTDRQVSNLLHQSYCRNLAHSLQQRLEQIVLAHVEKIRQKERTDSLCLGGGVACNNLLISRLERESGFQHVFASPAAGNSGNSLGAGLFLYHNQLGRGKPESLKHVFLGPEYMDMEVKPIFDNCKLKYRYLATEEKLTEDVVKLISEGAIVAWFQGRAEFGSRSLGGRSILANPMLEYSKENLNLYLKHQESWRPFAVSIPEDQALSFFENCSPISRFLLTVSRVRNDKRHLIPSAWFSNGMARVHLVNQKTSPLYWRLLTRFGEKTGIPILVNTSFNLFGEPIVCTPRDAVRSFYCSGIDALVINRFLIEK
ncbi:MAG: hypothetical protein IPM55_03100 [Acidobacteria bacterium]|nr:hypothetical protein [Acidobacteriota bacterium]